jgi:hypothetical protein
MGRQLISLIIAVYRNCLRARQNSYPIFTTAP